MRKYCEVYCNRVIIITNIIYKLIIMDNNNIIITMLKFVAVINAVLLGWNVKVIEDKKFVITKKLSQLTELDNNINKLLETLFKL